MKKCFHHLQKCSMLMACVRETLRIEAPDFQVVAADVDAAWSIVHHSIITMKCFKVSETS